MPFPMWKSPIAIPVFLSLAFLSLAGCQKQPTVRLKVLIGATTIVAPGAQPIEDSIVVIAGEKIRSVGMRKDVPVPPCVGSNRPDRRMDCSGERVAHRARRNRECDYSAPCAERNRTCEPWRLGSAHRFRRVGSRLSCRKSVYCAATLKATLFDVLPSGLTTQIW